LTGNVAIGNVVPSSPLHVSTSSTENPIQVDINFNTKFLMSSNGGSSIGMAATAPVDGLAVQGSTGIGTNSPGQKLEVVGAIKIGPTSTNSDGSIRYDGTNFQGHHNGTWINLDAAATGGSTPWTQSGSDVTYVSGNVGIGTTSPAQELTIIGDASISGALVAPSDRRLKDNIKPLKGALKIISQLRPSTYFYKENKAAVFGLSDDLQFGLIAQELEEVLPNLVSDNALTSESGKRFKGVEYEQLIPILTQAIKELEEENESLMDEINRQNKTLSSVLDRLSELEERQTVDRTEQ